MKILFLDIDGVMNNKKLLMKHSMLHIDDDMLDRLKRIVDATQVKIVLSSTWRLQTELIKTVVEKLNSRGLELFGCTVELRPKKFSSAWPSRSDEIKEWLSRHKHVEKFAILDDDKNADVNGRLFLTTFEDGLTEEITEKVISYLE